METLVSDDLYRMATSVFSDLTPADPSDSGRVAHSIFRSCFLSNMAEEGHLDDLSNAFDELDLDPTLAVPLTLNNLLRQVQERFDVFPFFQIKRVPQYDRESGTYYYTTRIGPPQMMFEMEDYRQPFDDALFLNNKLQKYNGVLGILLQHLAGATEASYVSIKLSKIFRLEWDLAQLLPVVSEMGQQAPSSAYAVRELEVTYPRLDWSLLTGLSSDDVIHVITPDYFTRLNDYIGDADKKVLKMYVYARALVRMFPYMPYSVRFNLAQADTRIVDTYSDIQCAQFTFDLAYKEAIEVTLETLESEFLTEFNFANEVAKEAQKDVLDVFSTFNGVDSVTRNQIISLVDGLRFRQELASSRTDTFWQRRVDFLPSDSKSTFLRVMISMLAYKNARDEHMATSTSLFEITPSQVEYQPLVSLRYGVVTLPVGQIHLGSFVKDVEFLRIFYKSVTYRAIIKHLFDKHLTSSEFLQAAECNLNTISPEISSTDQGKVMAVEVLVESGVIGLLKLKEQTGSTDAVQIGSYYFLESQLTYLASAQPLCQSQDISDVINWRGFVKPEVLVNIPSEKEYKRNVAFRCTDAISCFFWTINLAQSDGEGEGGGGDYGDYTYNDYYG